jgi:hypothetical protein
MRRLQLLAVLFGGLLLALTATANPLAPGACLSTPPSGSCTGPLDIFGNPSGTETLLATRTEKVAPLSNIYTGTLTSSVFRNGTGTLDFTYQFSNNASSNDFIARISVINFSGFTTDAGYVTGTGNAPLEADRSALGDTVGFDFFNVLQPSVFPSNRIGPGQSSAVLVIRTDAVNFTTGFASVIDGGAVTVFSYAPLTSRDVPTPEPATFGMIGAVLVGAAVLRRRSRRA